MASATGIPENNPALEEEEPLLGRPGDVTQKPGQALASNFVTGTGSPWLCSLASFLLMIFPAILAQIGIWVLTGLVWAAVFQHQFIFFSYHPVCESALFLVAALIPPSS